MVVEERADIERDEMLKLDMTNRTKKHGLKLCMIETGEKKWEFGR